MPNICNNDIWKTGSISISKNISFIQLRIGWSKKIPAMMARKPIHLIFLVASIIFSKIPIILFHSPIFKTYINVDTCVYMLRLNSRQSVTGSAGNATSFSKAAKCAIPHWIFNCSGVRKS